MTSSKTKQRQYGQKRSVTTALTSTLSLFPSSSIPVTIFQQLPLSWPLKQLYALAAIFTREKEILFYLKKKKKSVAFEYK